MDQNKIPSQNTLETDIYVLDNPRQLLQNLKTYVQLVQKPSQSQEDIAEQPISIHLYLSNFSDNPEAFLLLCQQLMFFSIDPRIKQLAQKYINLAQEAKAKNQLRERLSIEVNQQKNKIQLMGNQLSKVQRQVKEKELLVVKKRAEKEELEKWLLKIAREKIQIQTVAPIGGNMSAMSGNSNFVNSSGTSSQNSVMSLPEFKDCMVIKEQSYMNNRSPSPYTYQIAPQCITIQQYLGVLKSKIQALMKTQSTLLSDIRSSFESCYYKDQQKHTILQQTLNQWFKIKQHHIQARAQLRELQLSIRSQDMKLQRKMKEFEREKEWVEKMQQAVKETQRLKQQNKGVYNFSGIIPQNRYQSHIKQAFQQQVGSINKQKPYNYIQIKRTWINYILYFWAFLLVAWCFRDRPTQPNSKPTILHQRQMF